MNISYIGFKNDTLIKLPKAKEGDDVFCIKCGGKHPLQCGTSKNKKSDLILFYKCGNKMYLGAVAGKCTVLKKADV
jgi:hypothetical protein